MTAHTKLVVFTLAILSASVGCSGGGEAPSRGSSASGSGGSAAGSGGLAGNAGTTATSGAGGTLGSAGASSTGGAQGGGGSAGTIGTGGSGGQAGQGASGGASGNGGSGGGASELSPFSFFVTSVEAMQQLSGSEDGFGGDLRFGEDTGLAGADKICTTIAEQSMPGSGAKVWRAFLSTTTVNAIERIGTGPWYDRTGRLISEDIDALLGTRPGADPAIADDLPNETGVANRAGTGTGMDDNHDVVTGTNLMGEWDGGSTCDDWTSATGGDGPRVGHSWPAQSGQSWIQAHTAPGCEPSVNLVQSGPGSGNGIGNGGGYGGIYCFALMP